MSKALVLDIDGTTINVIPCKDNYEAVITFDAVVYGQERRLHNECSALLIFTDGSVQSSNGHSIDVPESYIQKMIEDGERETTE